MQAAPTAAHFEALEPRCLLSVAGPDVSIMLPSLGLSPLWFTTLNSPTRDPAGGSATMMRTSDGALAPAASNQWLVQLTSAASSSVSSLADLSTLLALDNFGGQLLHGLGLEGLVLIESGAGYDADFIMNSLEATSLVAWAEPDWVISSESMPNDPGFSSLWGLHNTGQTGGRAGADIDVPQAWAIAGGGASGGGAGIVVGVIDTGVDYTHPDLYLNIWINQSEIPAAVKAAIFANPDWDVTGDGHITFRDLNDPRNQGPGKITDLDGDGRITGADLLLPVSVGGWTTGADTDGNGFIDDLLGYDFYNNHRDSMDDHGHGTHVAGTIAAVGNNDLGTIGVAPDASIMTLKFLSSSGSGYTSDAVRAVNYATMMRTTYGVDVRVTNNSWGGGSYYKALNDAIAASNRADILFVAAAGNSGRNTDVSPNYPSGYEQPNVISVAATDHNDGLAYFSNYGAATVDLGAPGVSILSTYRGGYATLSGTSMATPHVAGVAVLAWGFNPGASAAEVRDAIFAGVDPLTSLEGRTVSGGRLNAAQTLARIAPQPDLYEDNDTAAAVDAMLPGGPGSANFGLLTSTLNVAHLNLVDDGSDWFKFSMQGAGRSGEQVRIDFSSALADVELRLYAADGLTLLGSSAGANGSAVVSLEHMPAGAYYVHVTAPEAVSSGEYSLHIQPGVADPVLNFSTGNPARFRDANGDLVVVNLDGPGSGQVQISARGDFDMGWIVLTGTTSKSSLTITLPNGGYSSMRSIHADGPVQSIVAKRVHLIDGEVIVEGGLKRLVLCDVDSSQIDVGSDEDGPRKVRVKMRRVLNSDLQSELVIRRLRVKDWRDTDQPVNHVEAPRIARLRSRGRFDPLVQQTDYASADRAAAAWAGGTAQLREVDIAVASLAASTSAPPLDWSASALALWEVAPRPW